jgi:hypothetical protein
MRRETALVLPDAAMLARLLISNRLEPFWPQVLYLTRRSQALRRLPPQTTATRLQPNDAANVSMKYSPRSDERYRSGWVVGVRGLSCCCSLGFFVVRSLDRDLVSVLYLFL